MKIEFKQYMREFLEQEMSKARGSGRNFNVAPGIIIRWDANNIDLEDFLDNMWVFITKREMQDENEKHS